MPPINISGTKIIDLSHALETNIPCFPGIPQPIVDLLSSKNKGDTFNLEQLTFCPHSSTHLDAPWHYIKNGKKIDELPPDCLLGPAVVVNMCHKEGDVPITAEDIKKWETTNIPIIAGDAVLFHTGHDKYWKLGEAGNAFSQKGWPYLTKDAAQYLASKKIRLVGVEPMSVDQNGKEEYPVHDVLLSQEILIIENLTNLDKVGNRCQLMGAPLKLKGGSGIPVRVLAVI